MELPSLLSCLGACGESFVVDAIDLIGWMTCYKRETMDVTF